MLTKSKEITLFDALMAQAPDDSTVYEALVSLRPHLVSAVSDDYPGTMATYSLETRIAYLKGDIAAKLEHRNKIHAALRDAENARESSEERQRQAKEALRSLHDSLRDISFRIAQSLA
ncbi:MAG: hypothetical protein PF961_07700 [Planctomycetota bacterium]|jgi:RPA family protein|nr:hypothetical protein [Planctomycetota bacterium]